MALVVTLGTTGSGTHGNGKASGHSIKVVWMLTHGHDFGNDRFTGPFHPENLGQLLEVLSGGLSY